MNLSPSPPPPSPLTQERRTFFNSSYRTCIFQFAPSEITHLAHKTTLKCTPMRFSTGKSPKFRICTQSGPQNDTETNAWDLTATITSAQLSESCAVNVLKRTALYFSHLFTDKRTRERLGAQPPVLEHGAHQTVGRLCSLFDNSRMSCMYVRYLAVVCRHMAQMSDVATMSLRGFLPPPHSECLRDTRRIHCQIFYYSKLIEILSTGRI